MGGDVQVIILLVPSDEMPADAPSRGVRRRKSSQDVPSPTQDGLKTAPMGPIIGAKWIKNISKSLIIDTKLRNFV